MKITLLHVNVNVRKSRHRVYPSGCLNNNQTGQCVRCNSIRKLDANDSIQLEHILETLFGVLISTILLLVKMYKLFKRFLLCLTFVRKYLECINF